MVARLRPGYGMWLPGYVLDTECSCFSFKVVIKYEAISLKSESWFSPAV